MDRDRRTDRQISTANTALKHNIARVEQLGDLTMYNRALQHRAATYRYMPYTCVQCAEINKLYRIIIVPQRLQ